MSTGTNVPTTNPTALFPVANDGLPEPDAHQSPMAVMAKTTPTRFFNDSCNTSELVYANERGSTGATSNPVICLAVLKQEHDRWNPLIQEFVAQHPTWSETQIAWALYRRMGQAGAAVMQPVHEAHGRKWGRISVQTNPLLHNNAQAMLDQSQELAGLGPNLQVKMPCTSAGVAMIEDATFAGVNLNVTVSFSVPQVLAIAEAIERGLVRRDEAGLDTAHMAPVATMMIGRLDDWLKVVAKREQLSVDPGVLDWAGIACAKRAYGIYQERGYRTKFLAAAYRHLGHWSELVGGDLVQTMPHEWQVKANRSGHHPVSRIDDPVDAGIMRDLRTMPEFLKAFEPNGMTVPEFDSFGPTRRTLRSFTAAWYEFCGVVRDVMVPDPD
jgi:transaldolase